MRNQIDSEKAENEKMLMMQEIQSAKEQINSFTSISNKNIESPLDSIGEIINLVAETPE